MASIPAGDSARSPHLLVRVHGVAAQTLVLEAELRIGRAEDNDLKLTDPRVSRYHAHIVAEGDTFSLIDLGSANGTLVNGVRLTAPHTLRHGELITIGDAELAYQEPRTSDATATPSPVAATPPESATTTQTNGRKRVPAIAIILALAALLVIVTCLAVYLFRPETFGLPGEGEPATATDQFAVGTPTTQMQAEATAKAPTDVAVPSTPVVSAVTPEVTEDATASVTDTDREGLLIQADALTQRSKFEEATVIYEELARQVPEDPLPEIGWAWALILDDEADAALGHAQQAVELDPNNADAASVLARAYLATGDTISGLALARKAVEMDPGNAEAQAVLAEAYLSNGQIEDAVNAADLALIYDSQNANAHRIRGWLYQVADGDLGRAASALQSSAGLQPELWLRRHELGLLLLEAGDNRSATIALQDALDLHPKAATYTALGKAYFRLDQYDEAQAALLEALLAGAEDADSYALLAASSAYQGQCDNATSYYEQALEIDATVPLALEARDICEGVLPAPTVVALASPTQGSPPSATPGATPQSTPRATNPPARPQALSGRIAFPVWNRERGKYDVFVANVDGSDRRLVVEEMHQPAFSPDGQWLAVNGERHEQMNLFIVRPNGSGLKEISRHIEDALPSWSPRDGGLTFSSTMHGDKQSRVYVIDRVPFEGRQQEGRPLNFGPDDVRGENPSWTFDERVVYKGCDSTVEPARCGLFIIASAAGAHPATQLTERQEDTAPATALAGSDGRIAFMSSRDANWEVYIMNADGSGLKRLTRDPAHDGLPTWSPDGRTLAFVSNQGGAWAVWAMSPDGTNRQKLFDIGGGGLAFDWQNEQISWGP